MKRSSLAGLTGYRDVLHHPNCSLLGHDAAVLTIISKGTGGGDKKQCYQEFPLLARVEG